MVYNDTISDASSSKHHIYKLSEKVSSYRNNNNTRAYLVSASDNDVGRNEDTNSNKNGDTISNSNFNMVVSE